MGAPGQAKPGGRKAGTPNKKTAALKQAVVEAVGAWPDAFEGDSYAFLATVYKDKTQPLNVRLDAAKTAIAYERPRLSQVAMTTRSLDQMTDEEFFRAWDSMSAFLAQHGRPLLVDDTTGPDRGGSEEGAAGTSEADASPGVGKLSQ